jgi:tRNA pseudouridine55 synthase
MLKNIINQIKFDEFGRPSGLLLVNKDVNETSHDVVNEFRRKFKFKKVGHAGALDKFATGLLLILVGKATKLSEQLLMKDKQYKATVLLGISSETQDIEGDIDCIVENLQFDQNQIIEVINSLQGIQNQVVSAYSSVKVNGNKLRKVLRNGKYDHRIYWQGQKKFIELIDRNTNNITLIEIPTKVINIYKLELLKFGKINIDSANLMLNDRVITNKEFYYIDILVDCSKGTYIRQLAEDIGRRLNIPAMLIALQRTKIADLDTSDIYLRSA